MEKPIIDLLKGASFHLPLEKMYPYLMRANTEISTKGY